MFFLTSPARIILSGQHCTTASRVRGGGGIFTEGSMLFLLVRLRAFSIICASGRSSLTGKNKSARYSWRRQTSLGVNCNRVFVDTGRKYHVL